MGFLELRRQCGVSHEVRRGAQGASRVAPGKSGLHVRNFVATIPRALQMDLLDKVCQVTTDGGMS